MFDFIYFDISTSMIFMLLELFKSLQLKIYIFSTHFKCSAANESK